MRKIGILMVGFLLCGCEGKAEREKAMREEAREALRGGIADLSSDHMAQNETSAIKSLALINSAQGKFKDHPDGEGGYAKSLMELSNLGLIDNVLGYGTKGGYVFSLSGDGAQWACSATPISENTGVHNYFVSKGGVVRSATGDDPAGAESEKIE